MANTDNLHQRRTAEKLIASRRALIPAEGLTLAHTGAAEGGCGVIGLASNLQVPAKHMLQSLLQMRNRGNGKGGGIAAVSLVADQFGVTPQVLKNDYLLAIAYLDDSIRAELEEEYIHSTFDVDHLREESHIPDFRAIAGLEVRPPEVVEYFVRPKAEVVARFIESHHMADTPIRKIEDEIVFQNSYQINTSYYKSVGEKQAFVLSHGKNMLVLKMVGHGDDVIRYYQLEEMDAHVWVGHHRYPTKGRVWHPGGAHPFVGLNEALVHNGDFANYLSIAEYLAQRNIYPLFLTDTEVAVQVYDLLHRTYDYPLEYVIETLAPTTERDFTLLPKEKQRIYEMLQQTHMHCSPDGPWFFLIAGSETRPDGSPLYRLTGITDTSMLRPQVFAWQENTNAASEKVAIGFAASEKQAIDAALESLTKDDKRFWARADRYWNARGGSYTDGGAFIFSVTPTENGMDILCSDKFGEPVPAPTTSHAYASSTGSSVQPGLDIPCLPAQDQFTWFKRQIAGWDYPQFTGYLKALGEQAAQDGDWQNNIDTLTLLMDRRYHCGNLRRSSLLSQVDQAFASTVESLKATKPHGFILQEAGSPIPEPTGTQQTVLIDARGYTPEDETSLAREIQRLYQAGFKRFLVVHAKGHRFIGNGMGSNTEGVRIDVYGSPGDYLASGIDGLEIQVHNHAQDQLAQIIKSGKLVVHGDVGQTFMYAAKGGQVYVLGNTAGRPLINAVGRPRVVINGTCLDYLAESFMAGDPLERGGFVVLNGIQFDEYGQLVDMDTPYPGGNLFSLASGGAIYVRDPRRVLGEEQLNGGEFAPLTARDWDLIETYLQENERLFDIPVERLLSVDGQKREPAQVYRKIQPHAIRALQAEEAWVTEHVD